MKEIKLEEFNSCPGKEAVERYLFDHNIACTGEGFCVIADAENENYYRNKEDTLVLRVKPTRQLSLSFQDGLELGNFRHWSGADEFHTLKADGYIYFRFWWD
jgi:hypothetical protein